MDEAENHFNIRYFDDNFPLVVDSTPTPKSGTVPAWSTSVKLSPIFEYSPTIENITTSDTNSQAIKSIISLFGKLSSMQQEQLLSRLLHQYMGSMSSTISSVFFPYDTIGTIASAMKNLADNDKPNLIYHLGKCLEPGKEGQSRLPMDRMPYGLLSHNIMFFSSEDVTNLHPEPHFVEWEISMFSHFGHKWAALQRGPMWSECDTKELPTVEVNIPETEEIVSTKKLPEEIQISHGALQTLPKEIQISCEDESCPSQGENNIIQQALAGIFDDDVAGEDLQSSIISEGIIPITDKEGQPTNIHLFYNLSFRKR